MKFIVEKTKPGFIEDEYDVRLHEKTVKKLRIAALITSIVAPTAAFVLIGRAESDTTENDTTTQETP